MPVDVLATEGLTFQYNSTEILADISFRLQAGDYLGLVGPNGSGKTTLIKLILGLLQPSKGEIVLFVLTSPTLKIGVRLDIFRKRSILSTPTFRQRSGKLFLSGFSQRKGSLDVSKRMTTWLSTTPWNLLILLISKPN